jgi:hypothetical protein
MRLVLASALIVGTLVASQAYPWTDTRATCRAQCGLVQQALEGWNDDQQAMESWSWFRKTCGQRGDRGYRRCKRQLIRRCRIDGASSACPEVTTTTTSTTSTTTVRLSTTTTTIRRTTMTTFPSPSVSLLDASLSWGPPLACNGRPAMKIHIGLCGRNGAPVSADYRYFRLVQGSGIISYGVNECHINSIHAGLTAMDTACSTLLVRDGSPCVYCWLWFDQPESFAGVYLYYNAYGYTATYDWGF